jgi:hypothetical protein
MAAALQLPGIPGGPEILIILVIIVIPILVGNWVYRDSKARGSKRAWQWGVGIAVLLFLGLVPGLVGLVLYLVVRDDKKEKQQIQ